MKFKPYKVLSADSILADQQPIHILINENHIVMIDRLPITVKKSSQFVPDGEIVSIPCPDDYNRIITNNPLMPIFFAQQIEALQNISDSDAD
jgi:hypothetical protein